MVWRTPLRQLRADEVLGSIHRRRSGADQAHPDRHRSGLGLLVYCHRTPKIMVIKLTGQRRMMQKSLKAILALFRTRRTNLSPLLPVHLAQQAITHLLALNLLRSRHSDNTSRLRHAWTAHWTRRHCRCLCPAAMLRWKTSGNVAQVGRRSLPGRTGPS